MDFIGNILGGALKGATGGFAGNNQPQASAVSPNIINVASGGVVNIGKTNEGNSLSGNSPLANSINPSSTDKSSIGMNKTDSNSIMISFNKPQTT